MYLNVYCVVGYLICELWCIGRTLTYGLWSSWDKGTTYSTNDG